MGHHPTTSFIEKEIIKLCNANDFPELRSKGNLFEFIIHFGDNNFMHFQEARMLYDKCIDK